jgi:hypothetical protein
LTRIFCKAPVRCPGLAPTVQTLCHDSFEALGAHGCDQVRQTGIEHRRVSYRLNEARQHIALQQFAARVERLRYHASAAEDQHIEDVIQNRSLRRSEVLERLNEGRPSWSRATTSPSMTVSSGRLPTTRTTPDIAH